MDSKAPKKPDFASDPRMTKNEQTGKWSFTADDGVEYEYDENLSAWFPMVSLSVKESLSTLTFLAMNNVSL
jgi:HIV Tat-specific factor 1